MLMEVRALVTFGRSCWWEGGLRVTFLGIRNTCYLDSSIDDLNVQWVKAELHELEECVLFSPTPYDCVLEIISCGSCPHSTHKPPLNNREYVLIKIICL